MSAISVAASLAGRTVWREITAWRRHPRSNQRHRAWASKAPPDKLEGARLQRIIDIGENREIYSITSNLYMTRQSDMHVGV